MAIKHKIRGLKGVLFEIDLTPRKAIKAFCLECMCWVQREVPNCTAKNCPLFPFRMGDAHSMSEETKKATSERMKERQKS